MNFDFSFWPWIVMMLVGMGFNIILAYWVYQDSINKQEPNPMLWAIIVLFTSLVGLLFYLLFSSSSKPAEKIPARNNVPEMTSKYDETAYVSFNKRKKELKNFCKSCGSLLEDEAKFCSVCGIEVLN